MRIAKNPINLRLATAAEIQEANELIVSPAERRNCGGYSHYLDAPDYILVSDSAFPAARSYYAALRDANGDIQSTGWIGVI